MSSLKLFRRLLIVAAAVMGFIMTAPLAAQEPATPQPALEPSTSSAPELVGPRVTTDWRALAPSISREPTPHYRAQHTLVISTLALVVIVVLLVLLIT